MLLNLNSTFNLLFHEKYNKFHAENCNMIYKAEKLLKFSLINFLLISL